MPATQPARLLQTLPLQIADRMAEDIVSGRMAPGERLREAELAADFAVSRATVREALRLLEQRGLVAIQPQRGARVTQLSASELNDLFEVRASLLATGSRLAAEKFQPGQRAALQAHLARLRANVEDLPAYATASAELVDHVMTLSGNAVLAGYIRDFAQRIGRYVRLGLAPPERRRRSLATWEAIVAAIMAGDGEAAEANHRRLALGNRDVALAEFARQNPPQD